MENLDNAIHRQSFRLHSYEVDQAGVAKPDILLSFMLDSAWAHTKNTEFSYSELRDEGQLWVLSRFLAVCHEMPNWDDEILIETWGKGTDKIFGLRDFIIHSKAPQRGAATGEKLVSATSAWLIIDRKTLRIQRIDKLERNFPIQLGKNEIDAKLEKIETQSAERTDFSCIVRYSDLNVNKHVNSSKYLQWILDSFPLEYIEKRRLRSFEINFLDEAKLGDEVYISMFGAGESFYCEVRRENDNADLCRANVIWGEGKTRSRF